MSNKNDILHDAMKVYHNRMNEGSQKGNQEPAQGDKKFLDATLKISEDDNIEVTLSDGTHFVLMEGARKIKMLHENREMTIPAKKQK